MVVFNYLLIDVRGINRRRTVIDDDEYDDDIDKWQ